MPNPITTIIQALFEELEASLQSGEDEALEDLVDFLLVTLNVGDGVHLGAGLMLLGRVAPPRQPAVDRLLKLFHERSLLLNAPIIH